MENLTPLPLGALGRDYVESCLQKGGRLSQEILKLSFRDGPTFSPLPQNVEVEKAHQFSAGDVVSPSASYSYLAKFITDLEGENLRFLAAIEDPWIGQSDVREGRSDNLLRFADSSIFYLIEGSMFDSATLEKAIKLTSSFLFIGVVSETALSDDDVRDRKLTDGAIEKIASNCKVIFVSAYDREGVVIWHR